MVDAHGALLGIITRQRLIAALAQFGPQHPVQDIVEPCELQVTPRMELTEAIAALDAAPSSNLPVIGPHSERLIGMLTSENIGELLMVRMALKK